MFHPFWMVTLFYGVVGVVMGISLSIVFQLAHCVEQAAFPLPREDTGRMENPWAVHEVETAVDFARRSSVATWLLGGLNFQIEHHLFPQVCHVNYPHIAVVVEQTCREFGIRYSEHPTVWAGVASHFRFLRGLSRANGFRR
jgi:linoleoyl-CoA desaturase